MASVKKVKLCNVRDINEGEIKGFRVENKNIMVIKIDNKIYVYDALCTHRNCNLARMGLLKNNRIICTCHETEFDIETGKPISGLARKPLTKYEFEVEDDIINIIIP
ncbi:Rieske (2Fe-2S) protein [Sulfolobus sp. E11-6]|uniref:Rieske (2Fe-2S) protein n=1 Tax=Sulfolobus sp. E11-6 TaxID=2663020 RepID=UPI001294B76C|nr:Rieske (2Fe-2S) protein [Sulfolobus sp. E11-6]QGA69018.1 Rieske 2Fe-2S domain-containing protein [Sulfolobus sp. E11-6]